MTEVAETISIEPVKKKRQTVITGNWKMYKTQEEGIAFVKELIPQIENSTSLIYLAVPFTLIQSLAEEAKNSSLVIGAQNMNDATEGAFTGEIAGRMLKEAGAQFVIIGHSERRHIFNEDNAFINRKIKRALKDELQPVLCIGETAEEHQEGQIKEVLRKQITECLADVTIDSIDHLIMAYEPVWAVGTGETPTPESVQEIHLFCREVLTELLNEEVAQQTVIQYGGSVNPSNAKAFLKQADVDGLLIGGASLSLETFVQIIHDSGLKI